MTVYPQIAVNGIAMDDPSGRWALRRDQGLRALPGIRATSVVIPGRSGALWPAYDPHDVSNFTLSLWVTGSGDDRNARVADLEQNLEAIYFLVSQTPVTIAYTLASGVSRQARCRVVSSSSPTRINADGAQVDFIFEMPDSYWRDASFSDTWVSDTIATGTVTGLSVDVLAGATAPISDAEFLIKGPFTELHVYCESSGGGFIIRRTTTSSEYIYVQTGPLIATVESGSTWPSTASSTDVTGKVTSYGTFADLGWMTLLPAVYSGGTFTDPTDREIRIDVKVVGSGSSTVIRVRGKRAYL